MLIYNLAGVGAVAPTYTTNQQFEAHEWLADVAAGVGYTFLNLAGAPNIVTLANPRLRVSANGRFAVEDADLTRRQPKHFFAAPAALAEWNKILARQGSSYQFFPDPPGTVTFTLPGAAAATTLTRVRAANLAMGLAGNAMTTTENCDGTVKEVIGSQLDPCPRLGQQVFLGSTPAQNLFFDYHIANHLVHGLPLADLPTAPPATHDAALDTIAQRFGEDTRALALGNPPPYTPAIGNGLQTVQVNQFARPTGVGQGLYSGSLGALHPLVPAGRQIQDYRNNRLITDPVNINRVLWGFHWGGVVAMDGTDYLTLENYARNGENSAGNGGRLFYFQMYGTAAGQTWHEQWVPQFPRGKAFANGLTVVVEPNGLTGLHYFVAGSKNSHAAVAAAVDNATLQRALLDGLNYAGMHLYATSLTNEYADRNRRTAWRNAVANLLAAPPAWLDAITRSLAQYVGAALTQVKVPPSL